jgi:2-dehydro-3-deoxygalactonokinase
MSGRTDWADCFIAVDWGTTNRRAYLVGGDGRHTEEFEDGEGILSVKKGEFEAAVGQIRERLGDRPLLLAGMIGSNRGWIDAPYVPCPVGIDDLAGGVVRADERTVIVPGVSYSNDRADVMRGEEVQLLGAVASGEIPRDCLVCHPGTHNKWIKVEEGRIESFRTVMTGELFSLLSEHSILSDLLDGKSEAGEAFCDGVRRTLSGAGVTARLFEARARFLLGRLEKADGPSFVSGLLIGEDVRVGLSETTDSGVIVMGRPELTNLYAAALDVAGVANEQVDGEEAFVAGAAKIAELLQ